MSPAPSDPDPVRYAGGLLRKAFFHWRQEALDKRGVQDLLASIVARIKVSLSCHLTPS